VLTESDNFEYANGTRATAAAPAQSSPPPPSQPAREPETGLRYMLAMRQLDCEIGRLRSPRLIDVAPGADVKPDILKDLLKVDVPDVCKSVDRARDALKTLTAVATVADAEKLLDAQDACEQAISWIAMVEERCKGEQLHLDVKQEPREVDFVPFRPGNGVSIFEFFHKFENWARGQMSQDHKVNVLYNRHLDFSVVDSNKELEDAKENYPMMKSLLIEKWGVADIVCDQYLEGIRRITMPADPKDKVGMLTYVKNAYSRLVTLTKLEVDRGQLVPSLEDYYLSNQFLKRIHRLLPEELGSKSVYNTQTGCTTRSLVYNTQTGKTRAVNITDLVVSTPSECACYVMQQLNIAGRRVLAFYDSGANSNIVEYDLARDAGFHQIGFQTVSFNVAGGGSVRSSYGQFSAILGPDVNGNIHNIECQAVDQITGTFPTFRLDDIIMEARATIGSHHVFPQEIGGAPVKLLIGIRSTQLAPVLKFTLPSGLCVYELKFRDVYGATLCFGGPHEVFTRGYKQAGFRVTSGMLQVLFTESATAYMGGI
jgi:hypothetical protein